jgi:hypothetical protein
MADLLMVLIMVAFIVTCVAYVWWCDRIIGPDPARADADDLDASGPLSTQVPV